MGSYGWIHLRMSLTRLLSPVLTCCRSDQLYKVHTSAPKVLGRIARVPNMVTLEMTQEAMQLGLLEPSLIATVLLSCGHNID